MTRMIEKKSPKKKKIDNNIYPGFCEAQISSALGVDIENKQVKQGLYKLNQFIAKVIEDANILFSVIDVDSNIIIWNRAAEKISGYSCEEVVGYKKIWECLYPDERYRNHVVNKVNYLLREKSAENFQATIRRKDGEKRNILWNACNLLDKDGNSVRTVVVGHDITDYESELEEINKLKSVLVLAGDIIHNLNNLMTAVLGNISLANIYLETNQTGKALEILKKAEEVTISSKGLTRKLLNFSEYGNPIKELTSISKLLKDIKESNELSLNNSNVLSEFSISDNLWMVNIDREQIKQVINNLIINTSESISDGGTIIIKAENCVLERESNLPLKAGDYVKISIEDKGFDISREDLTKLNSYFTTQGMASNKGIDLELATCNSIIAKNSGYMAVESEVDIGTTFSIYLPVYETSSVNGQISEKDYTFEKRRILVMEHREMIREVTEKILDYLGYDVDLAGDGHEAIDIYQKNKKLGKKFDAVILDLNTPGVMEVEEILEELLKIDSDIKAIVSSGYSNRPVMFDYKRYGFHGAIFKPYGIKELSNTLKKVMM